MFEGIRSYGGKVFRMEAHLDRLWNSAKAILLTIPMTKAEMAKAIEDTLAVNSIRDGYIRVIVTRGAGSLGLDPNHCSNPQVIIITDYISLYPEELYRKGLEIVTVSVARNHPARSARGSSRSITSTTSWPRSRGSRPAASRP